MFITEEQANKRLNSKDNIALKFFSALDEGNPLASSPDDLDDDDSEEDDDNLDETLPENQEEPEEIPVQTDVQPTEATQIESVCSTGERPSETRVGRSKGDKNLPPFMREIIGTTAHFDTAKHVAEVFGVSKSSVNSYKQGQTSLSNPNTANSQELKKKVDSNLDAINERAMSKLMMSLGLITEEKLEKATARDISTVAANVSRVISVTNPDRSKGAQVNVIFYAPNQRKEADYESVTVRDVQ